MKRYLLVALLLGACGTDYSISTQTLGGSVGGASWTFVAGGTDDFLSDEQHFFATLYASAVDPCGFPTGDEPHLILSIPTSPGEYDLSLQLNMTFVVYDADGPNNLIATDGLLRVDDITTDTISGGIHSKYDGDNEVDGEFQITICPP